ncbi:hypothetical protein ABKN59_002426 [Abortiporus biennis]
MRGFESHLVHTGDDCSSAHTTTQSCLQLQEHINFVDHQYLPRRRSGLRNKLKHRDVPFYRSSWERTRDF